MPRIISASRGRSAVQNAPASVGVRDVVPSRPHASQLSTNGGTAKAPISLAPSKKDALPQRDAWQGSFIDTAEPMEIGILGASSQANDEIKIKGAAECRDGDDHDPRGFSGGGISLLARLSNGGSRAKDDHGDGQKRKRNRRN